MSAASSEWCPCSLVKVLVEAWWWLHFLFHLPWVVADCFGQPCWRALAEWPAPKTAIDWVPCTAAASLKKLSQNVSWWVWKLSQRVSQPLFPALLNMEYSQGALLLWAVEVLFAAEAQETREGLAEVFSFSNFYFMCECSFLGEGEHVSGSSAWKQSRISRWFLSGVSEESVMHFLLLLHFLEHRWEKKGCCCEDTIPECHNQHLSLHQNIAFLLWGVFLFFRAFMLHSVNSQASPSLY